MNLDYSLTCNEKKEVLDIELREDYIDLWGYKGILAFVIPLLVFYIPINVFIREGYCDNFIYTFKLVFIAYGVIAYLLKAIEIVIRKFIYKKRKEELLSDVNEDESFHLEVKDATIFVNGKEENKTIKMADIIDVLEIKSYLAICYGEYGEYIFIPMRDFKDGKLYDFLASVNKNLKS